MGNRIKSGHKSPWGVRPEMGQQRYRDFGYYTVPYGKQDIEFAFEYFLENVLISSPSLEVPICGGDLNWFAVTLLPQGFVLHSDVRTDSATVMWLTIV